MEAPNYRENIELLKTMYPDRAAISVQEAAAAAGVNAATIYTAISNRRFPAQKVGERKFVIPITSFARWLCK